MYRIILTLSIMMASLALSWAQVSGFQYQAVVRDGQSLETNESVALEFTIKSGTPTGTAVYVETHNTATDAFGLVNVVIGEGTASTGTFTNIDWGSDDFFLEVKLDGVSLGTTQLLTVPYAKVATNMSITQLTDVGTTAPANDQVLTWDGSEWVPADVSASPWTTTGNNVYIDNTNIDVGIGTSTPTNQLEVEGSANGQTMVRMEATAVGSDFDILELQTTGSATASDGQFIEMQTGSSANDVVARVNYDGSAEFLSVTVEEDLPNNAAPEKGKVYADILPVAYGNISFNGTIITEFGVTSVTNPSTGVYEVTLDRSTTTTPVIIATSLNSTPDDEVITATGSANNNVIEFNIYDDGAASNSQFMFVVYGQTN